MKDLLKVGIVLLMAAIVIDIAKLTISEANGGNTPGKKIADDMERAYQQIKAVNDRNAGRPVDPEYLRELARDQYGR
jgi:hypothetical protein